MSSSSPDSPSKAGPAARRGRLIVISGPSGVGKGSLIARLVAARPDLHVSVSATTRPPRPGEVEGRDYRFVSEERFSRMVADDAFLEHAEVFGRHYGTPRGPVDDARSRGDDVLLEIDVEGARQVRGAAPDAVLVFIEPPSPDELRARLEHRGTEDAAEVARRLEALDREMAERHWFDRTIVNDDLDGASAQVGAILDASGPDA